jgi:hypothetical protein
MNLKKATTEELQAEIERRKSASKGPPPVQRPIDWAPLLSLIETNVRELAEHGSYGKDFEHYVYESALECVYGTEYWSWRRTASDE